MTGRVEYGDWVEVTEGPAAGCQGRVYAEDGGIVVVEDAHCIAVFPRSQVRKVEQG